VKVSDKALPEFDRSLGYTPKQGILAESSSTSGVTSSNHEGLHLQPKGHNNPPEAVKLCSTGSSPDATGKCSSDNRVKMLSSLETPAFVIFIQIL